MHVLLAEDDDEAAAHVERGLSALGHVVDVARSGGDALGRALSGGYEVIVLDRMLPEIDGVEVLLRLRAAAVTTPVMMLTALGGIVYVLFLRKRVAHTDARE